MPTYRKDFQKMVWGFIEVEANSPEEAEAKFEEGDYDMFDNKSEEEYGDEWEKQ